MLPRIWFGGLYGTVEQVKNGMDRIEIVRNLGFGDVL